MIYRKEALLHTFYKLLWKNFHFLQKSSIFALKNLNINHGKKT